MRFHMQSKRKAFLERVGQKLLSKRSGWGARRQYGGFVFTVGFGITCLFWAVRGAMLAARVARVAMAAARVARAAAAAARVARAAAAAGKVAGRVAGRVAAKTGKVVKRVAGRGGKTAKKRGHVSARSLPDFEEPGSAKKKKKKAGATTTTTTSAVSRHPLDKSKKKTSSLTTKTTAAGRKSSSSFLSKMASVKKVSSASLPRPSDMRFSRWDRASGTYKINHPIKRMTDVQIDSNRRLALAGF